MLTEVNAEIGPIVTAAHPTEAGQRLDRAARRDVTLLRAAAREPLVHFLTAGVVLLALSAAFGRSTPRWTANLTTTALAASKATIASPAARTALAARSIARAVGTAVSRGKVQLQARGTALAAYFNTGTEYGGGLELYMQFKVATLARGLGRLMPPVREIVLNPSVLIVKALPRALVAHFLPSRNLVATAVARAMVAAAQRRVRLVVMEVLQVSQSPPLTPPIDAVVEFETITFDYGRVLASGVSILGATLTATDDVGKDPSPQTRWFGTLQIGPSPTTGAPAQAVKNIFGGGVDGAYYLLQCVATTSDAQELSLTTHLLCTAPR